MRTARRRMDDWLHMARSSQQQAVEKSKSAPAGRVAAAIGSMADVPPRSLARSSAAAAVKGRQCA
jgi:hypothetical protein